MVDLASWQLCLKDVLLSLSPDDAAGLRTLSLASLEPRLAVICGAPDSFWKSRIERKLLPLLRQQLARHFPQVALAPDAVVDVRIGPAPAEGHGPAPEPRERARRQARPGSPLQTELPLDGASDSGPQPDARYTFANFLEGPCNRIALQLAQQVAAEPGRRFNPLVLVGKPGHGKTHLLHAIGHHLRASLGLCCAWNTAEGFANEIWDGIRLNRMRQVRERYRNADALLLDGLEFLQVTPKAQQELCHTLDELLARGRQIVVAIDRYPKELDKFDPALRSRLEMGLLAELGDMEQETRLKLIHSRARADGIDLPEQAAELLSARITESPRKLEGALLRIGAYAALMEQPITAEFVERMAQPFLEEPQPRSQRVVPADAILHKVCDHFDVPVLALSSRSRDRRVVQARRVVIYLLHECAGLSFQEIGALLGKRTHVTILQAKQKFAAELQREPMLRKFIETLRASLLA